MASVPAWSGPVTRNYSITVDGKLHTVSLFHDTVLGTRTLSVDGEDVLGTSGRSLFYQGPATLTFNLRGQSGSVTIAFSGPNVIYRCTYNGSDVPEENTVAGGSAGVQLNEDSLRMKITLDGYELGADDKGQPVVLYKLHSIRERDQRETVVHRRFNEFVGLNEALRACYKGSSLLGSIPSLPSRSIKLFNLVDHLAPDFINKRVFLLTDWLHKVVQVPRARSNPDLLTFLGLIDSVRETSVLFHGPSLGIALRGLPGGRGVEVTGLTKLPDGSPSPAAAVAVKAGDRVSKINGEDALSDGFDLVSARIKAAPRPVLVHFLGEFAPRTQQQQPQQTDGGAAAQPAPPTSPVVPTTGMALFTGSAGGTGLAPAPAAAASPADLGLC